MFYLFHGNDELAISEMVLGLRARLARDDALAELNYTELDGRKATLGDLQSAADAMPFMGERRLVVVRGLAGRCNVAGSDKSDKKGLAEGLSGYLPQVPPTTRLILWEGRLDANNPILKWAERWLAAQEAPQEAGLIRSFDAPKPAAVPEWLVRRAAAKGGAIQPMAARALADALTRDGEVDARLAGTELEKLLVFAGERAVTAEDVSRLITPVSLDSIFAFVDDLGRGQGQAAMKRLRQFLADGEHPLRILTMVVRQFRLIAMARAVLDGGPAAGSLESRLAVQPFIARKIGDQARRYSAPAATRWLNRLAELETRIKTGGLDGELALELFVAEVGGAAAARNAAPIR